MKIVAKELTKVFPVSQFDAFKVFAQIAVGRKPAATVRQVTAVDHITFAVKEGDRLGIIGRNGAGKTTLLQMIAGLASPTSGSIEINGAVQSLMTLGLGLKDELTGLENIYAEGQFKGKSSSEIQDFIKSIIEFAEIGPFINHPVRTYSSGMKARLAFSMMAMFEPDIIIIDEILSVGDVQFGQKASQRMKEICAKGKALIVVSHDMNSISELCNRCIWMEDGTLKMDGHPAEVTHAYLESVRKADEQELLELFQRRMLNRSHHEGIEIERIEFLDDRRTPKSIFYVGEKMTLSITMRIQGARKPLDLRVQAERTDGILLFENTLSGDGFPLPSVEGKIICEIPFQSLQFGKSIYEIRAELIDRSTCDKVVVSRTAILQVRDPSYSFDLPAYWMSAAWSLECVEGVDEAVSS